MTDADSVIFLDEQEDAGEAIDASSVIFLDDVAPPEPDPLDFLQNDTASDEPTASSLYIDELSGKNPPPEPLWKRDIEQVMPEPDQQGVMAYDSIARQYAENGTIPSEQFLQRVPSEHREYFASLFQKHAREIGPNKDKWKIEKLGKAAMQGADSAIPDARNVMGAIGGILGLREGEEDPALKSYAQTIKGIAYKEDDITTGEGWLMKSAIGAARMGPEMALGAGLAKGVTSKVGQALLNSSYWVPKIYVPEYESLVAQGVDTKTAKYAAAFSAVLQAGVESWQVGLGQIGGAVGLKQRSLEAAKAFLKEGVGEEALQGAISKMVEGVTIDGIPDPAEVLQEAIKQSADSAGPIAILQFPGAAISLKRGVVEDMPALRQWVSQNPKEAADIANIAGTPSRKDIDLLEKVGVLPSGEFRKQADRQKLKDGVVGAMEQNVVPLQGDGPVTLQQEMQPQDAPYQDLPVEQQQPPVQEGPPQEPGGEQLPPIGDMPPNYVSAKNAMRTSDRGLIDSGFTAPSVEKVSAVESVERVRSQGMVEGVGEQARNYAQHGLPDNGISVDQQTAYVLRQGEILDKYDSIIEQLESVQDQAQLTSLAAEQQLLELEMANIEEVLNRGGTIAAQVLAMRKPIYDRWNDFRPVTLVNRMKAAKGKPLEASERAQIQEMAAKIKEQDQRINDLEQNRPVAESNAVIKKTRESKSRKKRKEAQEALPDAYAKAQELFDAGCLGF